MSDLDAGEETLVNGIPPVPPEPAPRRGRRALAVFLVALLASLVLVMSLAQRPEHYGTSSAPQFSNATWAQTLREDFDESASPRRFASVYSNSWCAYDDGNKYQNSRTLRAHDGVMDVSLDGIVGAAGAFGPPDTCWGHVYGRYSIRFRALEAARNGAAIMLWPSSNVWGEGEIDFPEGNFDDEIHVFHHPLGCGDCAASDHMATGAQWNVWHTATIEWTPDAVRYYLDDALVKTVTENVPTTPHRHTVQVAPNGDAPEAGHFLVDWVAQWRYVPAG